MKEHLEEIVWVVIVGTTVAIGAKRVGVPFNVALVVAGLLGTLLDLVPHVTMDPELVLLVFLPILVFEGALFADATSLRREVKPIVALALPGVALSLFTTAAVATYALSLPFAAALLVGALLSITDTVSVLLAFRSARVSHRLAAVMEGESLFNDGTALVLVALCASVVASGRFSIVDSGRSLVMATVGGVGVGFAAGALGTAVLRRTPDHLTAILASTGLAFATSLLAERVHASPVIAVVVAGMVVGAAARKFLEPTRVLALHSFWETAGFVVNVFLFLLVGMQLDAKLLLHEAPSIVLTVLALHAGRAVAVYGCFAVMRAAGAEPMPLRFQHVMVFGNIKGALSMAAVLALPPDLPFRQRIVAVVFGVTLVTLLSQALPFGRFLAAMKVVVDATNPGVDDAKARLVEARRGQIELDELLASGMLSRMDHAERRAAMQLQLNDAERLIRAASHGEHDHVVDQSLLLSQKAALLDAARRGLVSNAAAAGRVADIDRRLVELNSQAEEI
jgi:monovalent cation:H+ antiporter, CPA1 family